MPGNPDRFGDYLLAWASEAGSGERPSDDARAAAWYLATVLDSIHRFIRAWEK